ncbi:MAG: WYL domain-containing protein [Clostridia bacterium]|nr:WYL domain-containing protein [Clostridia bacterium]
MAGLKQKIKILKLYEILSNKSDEANPLSTQDLIDRLKAEGISVERKTLYDDIELLNNCGYEIMQVRKKQNMYYVSDRNFDTAEVRILIDAVGASSFITPEKTDRLIDKIASLAGSHKGEVIKNNIVVFDTTKRDNEQIYYNVFNINEAIITKKKISFKYYKFNAKGEKIAMHDDKPYKVNPIATMVSNDNYYLICVSDKYKDVSHYRIDRMENVKIMPDEITLPDELKDFDPRKNKKQIFSMYLGKTQNVTFEIEPDIVEVIFDKFGKNTKLSPYGDKYRFTTEIQISDSFFGWCMGLGTKIEIISPRDVKAQYLQKLHSVICKYK